ncbi:hypothetical protein B0H19DRAFT_1376816 [Mycena capillaripes]|nr:hypothetical protein B0H19DRAFT_1376816 [Mycena capillaripes]
MKLPLLAPLLFAAFGLVRAIDHRLLYAIPVGDSIDTFTSDFDAACASWPPAAAAGLMFDEPWFNPATSQETEAKIFFTWTDGTTFTTFTEDVAASLGATELSGT